MFHIMWPTVTQPPFYILSSPFFIAHDCSLRSCTYYLVSFYNAKYFRVLLSTKNKLWTNVYEFHSCHILQLILTWNLLFWLEQLSPFLQPFCMFHIFMAYCGTYAQLVQWETIFFLSTIPWLPLTILLLLVKFLKCKYFRALYLQINYIQIWMNFIHITYHMAGGQNSSFQYGNTGCCRWQ